MIENLNSDGIHEFLEKYQNAKNFNSKELRLTIQEAERLSVSIGLMLSRYKDLSDRVISLQEQLLAPDEEVTLSGGDFS